MSNIRFFQCKECGLMAASLNDKVIPNLNELIPNTVEASGEKHKVFSIPTLVVYKNGEITKRASGVHTEEELLNLI